MLEIAAENGHVNLVQYFMSELRVGANGESRHGGFGSPICMAAKGGHLDVVRLLVEAKADTEASLGYATQYGHLHVVTYLLSKLPDLAISRQSDNPFFLAAKYGHLDILRLLAKMKGLDVNKSEYSGVTPLSAASENGHLDVITWLVIEMKAKSYTCSSGSGSEGKCSPVCVAIKAGHYKVVEFFVNRGFDLPYELHFVWQTPGAKCRVSKIIQNREYRLFCVATSDCLAHIPSALLHIIACYADMISQDLDP
jgi:hypothetical protein